MALRLKRSSQGVRRKGTGLRALILAVVFAAIWLPRGLALDRVVTPDEPLWLTRSANFYLALDNGDWKSTYQSEHPGVTVMWMGTLGYLWRYPTYVDDGPRQWERWQEEVAPFLEARGYKPLDLLQAGRTFMVLAVSIVLALAFLVARRVLGMEAAFLGFLLIAADPFHTALSRLLHVDGLVSSLMLLSLLALISFVHHGRQRADLLVSAAATGFAMLTKTPALFLIPFAALLLLLELERQWRAQKAAPRENLLWGARVLVLWGSVALFVFVLLWPALWSAPVSVVRQILLGAVGYAAAPHRDPLFFDGAVTADDPGLAFYPTTYLWRTTPIVLAGLFLAAIAFLQPGSSPVRARQRRVLALMALYVLFFTLFISLGEKKFDRYLLPIYPPLALIAAAGWVAAAGWLRSRAPVVGRPFASLMLMLAVLGQFAGSAPTFPYYLSYYNPLLGGTRAAPTVMMVGWGEGLDQAAHYLNGQSRAEEMQVLTRVWNGSFSYFFEGHVQRSRFYPGSSSAAEWRASDYCVIYVNELQRQRLPHALLAHLARLEPLFIVRLQGQNYAYVYDIRDVEPPAYMLGTARLRR